jgi:GNAT superfamily N-acetyltransferase
MKEFDSLIIEPLNPYHVRAEFRCGIESLDRYLTKQAGQDIKRRISRVYIAVKSDRPDKIIGYYTLSSLSIELQHLPQKLSKKLPRHPIPAALIGRLAVSQTAQGNGVGKMLLADAIKRTLAVSKEIAIYAIVVDSINNDALHFYKQFGFIPIEDENYRLFIPL